jgi:plasmid stability protein
VANLTIKGIDSEVLKRLKADAQRHRRSLNQEVILRLESGAMSTPMDPDTFLAKVRHLRVAPRKGPLTDRLLTRLKRRGPLTPRAFSLSDSPAG